MRESPKISILNFIDLGKTGKAGGPIEGVGGHDGGGCWNLQWKITQNDDLKLLGFLHFYLLQSQQIFWSTGKVKKKKEGKKKFNRTSKIGMVCPTS